MRTPYHVGVCESQCASLIAVHALTRPMIVLIHLWSFTDIILILRLMDQYLEAMSWFVIMRGESWLVSLSCSFFIWEEFSWRTSRIWFSLNQKYEAFSFWEFVILSLWSLASRRLASCSISLRNDLMLMVFWVTRINTRTVWKSLPLFLLLILRLLQLEGSTKGKRLSKPSERSKMPEKYHMTLHDQRT